MVLSARIKSAAVLAVVLATSVTGNGQRLPPAVGRSLPHPGANRIEVRFAIGNEAVICRRSTIKVSVANEVLFKGKFASGFNIPTQIHELPDGSEFDIAFACDNRAWRFKRVPKRSFSAGWWWVGTDYPPFQEAFQGDQFTNAIWIKYMLVRPMDTWGVDIFHSCPSELKDKNPGPCFEP